MTRARIFTACVLAFGAFVPALHAVAILKRGGYEPNLQNIIILSECVLYDKRCAHLYEQLQTSVFVGVGLGAFVGLLVATAMRGNSLKGEKS